jgi:hypothetical protein
MDHSKSIGRKALFAALVIGMVVLFLGHAAQAQSRTRLKTVAEEASTWKTSIGNRYQIERPIDVHGSPLFPRDLWNWSGKGPSRSKIWS